jgi:hypothetical protein
MNLRLRFPRTTGLCDPHENKYPSDIGMELQDGFFGHIVSLTLWVRDAFLSVLLNSMVR